MNSKRILAFFLCIITVIISLPCLPIQLAAEEQPTTIIAASDFQPPDGSTTGIGRVRKIFNAMKKDGISTADGFFFCGDYDYSTYGNVEETKEGIELISNVFKGAIDRQNMVFVQGNHDAVAGTAGQNPSGNNDPQHNKYGVYVINNDDYMWHNSDESRIKKTTQKLINYLNKKLEQGYDKPIFILSHLPLHYSMRTRLEGDAKYANYLFDVLNQAGAKGLNIVYLFGHDHANGWDDYLGGSSVYLAKGDTIQIAQKSQSFFLKKTLNFTYMNAGYTGYYHNHNGADDTLTMSYISIASDGTVTVTRYDENGKHDLKSQGVTNTYKGESGYKPDTTIYPSPQIISPTKVTDKTPIEDIMELKEGGKAYKRINSVSELKDGGKYVLVYNSSTDKIMVPKVVEKSNSEGKRIGFELEKTYDFGENIAYFDLPDYEWTFVKSGNGWKLSYNNKFIKLTNTTDKKITATLEDSGNVFTIKGESAYTFTSGSYMFNYNVRDLMNAFTAEPASFYIYEYAGYSLNIQNGLAKVDGKTTELAFEGAMVTIEANPATAGMVFESWSYSDNITLSDPSSPTATFTMPNSPIEIKANYTPASEEPEVTTQPTSSPNTTHENVDSPSSSTTVIISISAAVAIAAIAVVVFIIIKNKKK